MRGLEWSEWVIGLIAVWLILTPCLLGLSLSEELWNLGFAANNLFAGAAMSALGARALLTSKA